MRLGWNRLVRGTHVTLAALVSGAVISACSPTPAAAPTTAPAAAAPTTAPAAAKPTQAPPAAAQPTVAPTTAPAAAKPAQAQPTSASSYTGPNVELTFTNFYTGPDLAIIESMLKQFNSDHPNIAVKNNAIAGDTEISELPQLVAAGKASDVEAHHDFGFPQLAPRGVFVEFTPDMLSSMGITRDQYFPNIWDLGTVSQKVYGIPWGATAVVTYYNKTLMQKMGVTAVPTNRDELLAAGKSCTTDAVGKHPGDAGFDSNNLSTYGVGIPITFGSLIGAGVLKSNGGNLWDSSYNVAFNSPQAAEALQFMSDLSAKYSIAPAKVGWEDDIANFRAGKSCFALTGAWELKGNQDTQGLSFGVARFPKLGTVQDAAWGGAAWLTLPKQPSSYDKNKRAAAVEFVKWMTSQPGSLAWTKSGNLSARPDVANSPDYANNPMVETAKKLDLLYIPSGFPWIGQVNDGWNNAFNSVMIGTKAPADALTENATEAQKNVEQAKPNYPNFP
jgi:multiple sugar transport system substrate-binding protein